MADIPPRRNRIKVRITGSSQTTMTGPRDAHSNGFRKGETADTVAGSANALV